MRESWSLAVVRRVSNPRERDHNYQISYRDTDRQRAVKVVQIMLDSFIEDTLKKRRSGFQDARDFLQQQIRQQEQRLAEAEQKLAEFKRRNIGRLPTEQGSYVDSLQVEMTELQNLRSQESILLSRRQQLTTQLAAERQYVPSDAVSATSWRDPAREWQRPRFPDP